ncbi:MAG TPA: S41 family peptidase [Anaerolineae bacterium]|nr:S41 family peptidase [Anaerolineae bacterium]
MSSSTRRTISLAAALVACLCLAYVAGFGAFRVWHALQPSGQPEVLGVFWEAWDLLERHFYGELPSPQARTYGAIHAALALLNDPYTVFVEPQPRELERDRLRGTFGGIGATLWRNAEGRVVLFPLPDSPAARAGVQEGDLLAAVDGLAIAETATMDDVRAWLQGEAGTPVTLTLSRPPTPPLDLVVTREEIQVPSVTWRVLDVAADVGYVRVESFTERTGDEVVAALQVLQGANVSGLVLDLRDNSGGLVDPAVSTASQFLREGVVLVQLSRDGQERSFPVQAGGVATGVPLAVLVNGGTASAAEIVAGALQDYGRAPLVGERTFGKGAVQLIYDLSDGSSLHVTSATWLTPNRRPINGQGLAPDVAVPRGEGPQDVQLERAVEYLRGHGE